MPLATTVKKALVPVALVRLCGWLVIRGWVHTVNTAASLNTTATALDTTTRYSPAWLAVTAGSVNTACVWPGRSTPSCCHW